MRAKPPYPPEGLHATTPRLAAGSLAHAVPAAQSQANFAANSPAIAINPDEHSRPRPASTLMST